MSTQIIASKHRVAQHQLLLIVLLIIPLLATSFAPPISVKRQYAFRKSLLWDSSPSTSSPSPNPTAIQLKEDLLAAVKELRQFQERDGDFSDIDWGVKGGELNEVGRVPNQVDYSLISKDVGAAANKIISICKELSENTPTPEPTLYLGDKENGDKAPLNGAWKLLFTNAADAVFSQNSKRGAAKTQNVVNAKKGKITNVIDFETLPDGREPALKQLNVIIKATAVNKQRVVLNFQYAKIVLTKLFFIPLFGKKLSLFIPVPATFITNVIEFFKSMKRLLGLGKKKKKDNPDVDDEKRSPKGYFDVLYLDQDLRVHKTGQENLFVQAREGWAAARPLLQ